MSAFSPIVAPLQVPQGQKALSCYLGADKADWRKHDAVALIEDGARAADLLVNQGEMAFSSNSCARNCWRPRARQRAKS